MRAFHWRQTACRSSGAVGAQTLQDKRTVSPGPLGCRRICPVIVSLFEGRLPPPGTWRFVPGVGVGETDPAIYQTTNE